VRTIATLGGILCIHLDFGLWPLLASFGAELEFRIRSKTIVKNIWYLADNEGLPSIDPSQLLVRIRIPLQPIRFSFYSPNR